VAPAGRLLNACYKKVGVRYELLLRLARWEHVTGFQDPCYYPPHAFYGSETVLSGQ